jgi:hypothetical protein
VLCSKVRFTVLTSVVRSFEFSKNNWVLAFLIFQNQRAAGSGSLNENHNQRTTGPSYFSTVKNRQVSGWLLDLFNF